MKPPRIIASLAIALTGLLAGIVPGAGTSLPDDLPAPYVRGALLYQDDFQQDLSRWVVEQAPGGTVRLVVGQLDIDDAAGCTVWFTNRLAGPVLIEYTATLIRQGGPNDRVSDLNCFWMATDPHHPDNLFFDRQNRGGIFKHYDRLRLYYVGYGANGNTTTRFRRYPGDGTRPILPENDLNGLPFLNVPNQTVRLQALAAGHQIWFRHGGQTIFAFNDPHPFPAGWFGFRTVKSHLRLAHFRVYRLVILKS